MKCCGGKLFQKNLTVSLLNLHDFLLSGFSFRSSETGCTLCTWQESRSKDCQQRETQ